MVGKNLSLLMITLLVMSAPVIAQPLANPLLAGYAPVVPEYAMEHNGVQNGGNWEAYCDAFGDGTLAAASIREDAADTFGTEETFVALFNTNNSVVITNGFYTESPGTVWDFSNDLNRASGNPARIGCDKRPGGTRYFLANEATPWFYPTNFPSYQPAGFTHTAQSSTVQLFDKTGTADPTPLTVVEDPMSTPADTGTQNDQRRFGGEVRGLSNGGFVITVESNDTSTSPTIVGGGNNTPARWEPMTIYDNDGNRVLGPINANHINPASQTTGWSNVAAYNGGFAVFPGQGHTLPNGNRTIMFWQNDGTPDGQWEYIQNTSTGEVAPFGGSSTSGGGGGSGSERINSHIASQHIYYHCKGVDGVYITKIDTTTKLTVKEVLVNDTFATGVSRVMGAVDENDNTVVVWSTESGADTNQMICRFYDSNLDPVSDAFYCFPNANQPTFTSRRPSCALHSDGRALFTGRFEGAGATGLSQYAGTFDDDQIAIVLQQPAQVNLSGVDNWTLLD